MVSARALSLCMRGGVTVSAPEKERGVSTKFSPATRPVKHHSQDRKLEVNLQCELDVSGHVDLPRNPAVRRWAINVRSRAAKHGVIEEVKELRTEFNIELFGDGGYESSFHNRKVFTKARKSPEIALHAPHVAEGKWCGSGKGTDVQVQVAGRVEVGIANTSAFFHTFYAKGPVPSPEQRQGRTTPN